MTIQEYDSKSPIREKINQIDKALKALEDYCSRDENSMFYFEGIGPVGRFQGYCITNGVNDEIITQKFKAILLERKKELIDEFIQDSSDK